MSDFTNSWFCSLRGYAATAKEKHDTFYLAAIMPLLDDLTDSLKIPSIDIIKDKSYNDKSYNYKNSLYLTKVNILFNNVFYYLYIINSWKPIDSIILINDLIIKTFYHL